MTDLQRLFHVLRRERRVDDKVAIVSHDRACFVRGHAQLCSRRTEGVQVLEQLGVCKRRYLNRDAHFVLWPHGETGSEQAARKVRTVVPRTFEFLR